MGLQLFLSCSLVFSSKLLNCWFIWLLTSALSYFCRKLTLGIPYILVWFKRSSGRYVSDVWRTWLASVGSFEFDHPGFWMICGKKWQLTGTLLKPNKKARQHQLLGCLTEMVLVLTSTMQARSLTSKSNKNGNFFSCLQVEIFLAH